MNQWRYIKDILLDMYPELTNGDLNWGRVSRNDLLELISNKLGKLGKTQKALMSAIDSF